MIKTNGAHSKMRSSLSRRLERTKAKVHPSRKYQNSLFFRCL